MRLSKTGFCEEKLRLMEKFIETATDLAEVQNAQVRALIDNDQDFGRFELQIHQAADRRRRAKYAYMVHVEKHGC
jgi:hypothetical protein